MASLHTPACDLFGIRHPVLNAGMDVVASPELAAAVTNAGGLGVFGGVHYAPWLLRSKLEDLVEALDDKNAPFGVDLALPPVGGNARKTNHDYTHGKLDELIDIIIEFKPKLFVSALGVPPVHIVQKLHKAGILVMNMVGHPKHVKKALDAGVDLLCAQGGEAGGHTGDIPFSILIPAIVDAAKGASSPLTGKPVYVIAAGAVHSGRSLAAALSYGAIAVWVGTLFIASEEAGCPKMHQKAVLDCDYDGTAVTLIFSGRPLRVRATPVVRDWENNRQAEIQKMVEQGVVPVGMDDAETRPYLMGKVAAMVGSIKPARQIVEEMVQEAVASIKASSSYLVSSRSSHL